MSTELVKQDASLAGAPDYVESTGAGLENVTRGDITFPRIQIAQSSSPVTKKSDDRHIEGIEEGDLYNTLTKEIYKTPLRVVPIYFFKHYIKFRPMEEGGGVLRMQDTADGITLAELQFGPNGEKPIWTELFDFLVYLPAYKAVAVMSMKSTQAKIAKKWLAQQTMFAGRPSFAMTYLFRTVVEKGKVSSYYNYTEPSIGGFVDKDTYTHAQGLYKLYSGSNIKVDDTDFSEREDSPAY